MQAFRVIVIGGGHAGVEAAWAAANLFREPASVALVSLDPSKIGVMSCNPAIGGLAKGQIVREIDALHGLMALATDATGIQFRVLNTSKGAAVHGPRAQCDKHAYAREVQRLIASRPEITVIPGSVERLIVESAHIRGVAIAAPDGSRIELSAPAVVLTTGTFMRGLMHTGEKQTPGGRFGEAAAVGISAALRELGFELGRLKTGTPPRLKRSTIDWNALEEQLGDPVPRPFSHLATPGSAGSPGIPFPPLPQVDCRVTRTTSAIHDLIRENLHRAPMYSGQIDSVGPRYCPSIEDKVVKFADRTEHSIYLEPESLEDDWIYCNGISTSLPADVQTRIVRGMPGCENAEIYRFGYAVEYDMVKPHQIGAHAMTKLVAGLFLAGQINGTSGYEEAAAQGIVAGLNAARYASGHDLFTFGRDQAYIGVLMDDLITKTPVEPYRMFTSRAEHRLQLRADNASDRLTPLALSLGLLKDGATPLDNLRIRRFQARRTQVAALTQAVHAARIGDKMLADVLRRPDFTPADFARTIAPATFHPDVLLTVQTEFFYSEYSRKATARAAQAADHDRRTIPPTFDFSLVHAIRNEARQALLRFRPQTLGQAGRLEGITPADVTLLSVLIKRHRAKQSGPAAGTTN